MLTQRDLDEIEKVVDENIGEKTRNLPTKNEFFDKMDEVVGELQKLREETTTVNGQYERINKRVDEAPSTLRSGYLLPTLRRERNPSEAKNSSLSSTGLRPRYFAKGDKIDLHLGIST